MFTCCLLSRLALFWHGRYSCPCTFQYYVTIGTQIPVKFATADQKYVVLYDVESLKVGPQPAAEFALPPRCANPKPCTMRHPVPPEG